MLGTRGVPAQYGGFETAVEEIGARLVALGHEVVVFCRGGDETSLRYRGMELIHLPALKRKVAETLSHTTLSVLHPRLHSVDMCFLFNAANAPLIPVLRARGIPIVIHVDGLEWQRSKWGRLGKHYYRVCERLAFRWADELIADSRGIQHYYRETYGVATQFIAYGAPIQSMPRLHRLAEVDLRYKQYHLVVSRFEPENQVHIILDGYTRSEALLPLVVVGHAPYQEEYVQRLQRTAASDPRIRMLGGIWDQELLDVLYGGASIYLHGHSVGGTNPSLLRAMGAAAPVAAFDVVFNREVLGPTGLFWTDAVAVGQLLERVELDPIAACNRGVDGQSRVASLYDWDAVSAEYESLARNLLTRRQTRRKEP